MKKFLYLFAVPSIAGCLLALTLSHCISSKTISARPEDTSAVYLSNVRPVVTETALVFRATAAPSNGFNAEASNPNNWAVLIALGRNPADGSYRYFIRVPEVYPQNYRCTGEKRLGIYDSAEPPAPTGELWERYAWRGYADVVAFGDSLSVTIPFTSIGDPAGMPWQLHRFSWVNTISGYCGMGATRQRFFGTVHNGS
jgi:hypothetical protein